MTFIDYLPLLMFIVLLCLILLGFPVAFTLAGTAIIFGFIGQTLDIFHYSEFGFIPSRIWGIMSNITLMAVPLFVFMGLVLEKSGIANRLLDSASILMRGRKGSLAYAVILVGAILGASTGIVGATVVTMGVLALPSMLQKKYRADTSCGVIAASGTLGQIIPPSIILVLLGEVMSVDVGDLFLGALLPGLLLVALYALYVFFITALQPEAFPKDEVAMDHAIDWVHIFYSFLAPMILMFLVLGSILFGIASPTEAAACGAVGATVMCWMMGKFSWTMLREVMNRTAIITSMVFMILIGAQFFGTVFRGLYGDDAIAHIIEVANLGSGWTLFYIMLLMFILGFFLDFLEICFIVIPIVQPILVNLGYDTLWIAILIALNLQTSFLTPPFGFALFYLKGVVPAGVDTRMIYKGVIPFVALQLIAILVIALAPQIVTWLPQLSSQW
jgi:tripartite ATP-independent transporter DctM subunit